MLLDLGGRQLHLWGTLYLIQNCIVMGLPKLEGSSAHQDIGESTSNWV